MGRSVISLFVLVAVGVILADLVMHSQGTSALFNGVASLWSTSVNGMLGGGQATTSAAQGQPGSVLVGYSPPASVNAQAPRNQVTSA